MDSIKQSFENLLNYVETEHDADHRDGYCDDEKGSDCVTCNWLAEAKENYKKLVE